MEGDLDANLGVNDDDLLGDFGDDFNILEFADALDGNDSSKTNILDDLEADDSKEGEKSEDKPPPYAGANPPDPSRPPPPPYPGPGQQPPQQQQQQQQQMNQKVRDSLYSSNLTKLVCPFIES